MTREQAREAAAVMLAWADGKEVQFKLNCNSLWTTSSTNQELGFDWSVSKYRIKPAKTLRPWTADEVPLGAFIRPKQGSWRSLILAVDSDWRIMVHCGAFTREAALERHEHSLDGGKTWKECGVYE